ncbi:uncharacterized protein K441DRAFT_63449 [Cenococcum geophilum 1.58]|uniref:uncharacterized protein n=1 Tax=Cenococcum geophilum 1.58 TaxID=794803 RepID=UPI00358EAB71|nr:hypothetical protein K441DRAFT_63449 [Cenococcum geophilum 1.58]
MRYPVGYAGLNRRGVIPPYLCDHCDYCLMATTFRDADRPRTCKLAQRCIGIREPVGKPGRRLVGRWSNQSQRLKRAARADRFSQRNFEILWMVFCGSGGLSASLLVAGRLVDCACQMLL